MRIENFALYKSHYGFQFFTKGRFAIQSTLQAKVELEQFLKVFSISCFAVTKEIQRLENGAKIELKGQNKLGMFEKKTEIILFTSPNQKHVFAEQK